MREKGVTICLVLFLLLAGIGQASVTPPFEGFDEEGHYAAIRQIAQTGRLPLTGEAFFDRAVIEYKKNGPIAYASNAPYDANKGMTYPAFFDRAELVQSYPSRYREPDAVPAYQPSAEPNWQAQHPPLYYLLMAPVAKATQGLSFWAQFFVLRLVSYLLALAGWGMGLWGALRFMKTHMQRSPIFLCPDNPDSVPNVMASCGPAAQKRVLAAFLFLPVLVPQFIPEFARLGNDSLCLFWMGGLWALFLRWLGEEDNAKLTLLLGVVLAAGLLTKALFLPIAAGMGGFLLFRIWQAARCDAALASARFDASLLLLLPSLFAFFWYLYKWKTTGSLVGHTEYAVLAERGGLLANWPKNVSFQDLFFGFYAMPSTFSWAGTASLARPYLYFQFPLLLFPLFVLARYLIALRRSAGSSLSWLPLWIFFPFLFGLVYHQLAMMALGTYGGTPAWYLHILLPPLAFAFSRGMDGFWEKRAGKKIFLFFGAYALFFMAFVFWAQLPLFAGIASEDPFKIFSFSAFPFDLPRFFEVMGRLDVLVWPYFGLACLGAALLFLGGGLGLLGLSFKEKVPRG